MSHPDEKPKLIVFDGCSDELPMPKRKRFEPISAFKFATLECCAWVIKNIIPEAELIVIYGPSQSGKTFLTLDLLMSVVRGLDWFGNKTTKGRVVYIGAESAYGVKKRLYAYASHHQISLEGLEFDVIPDCPDLLSPTDVQALVQQIGHCKVVVIDTFSRVIPGGSDSDGEDVGLAIAACQKLHELTKAVVILIHHTGHNQERARGWSGLKAAVDTEISIEALDNRQHVATITKQKDGEAGQRFGFTLDQIVLGQDEDGENITSCVVVPMDETPEKQTKDRPLGKWECKIKDAFEYYYKPTTNSFVAIEQVISRVVDTTPRDPNKKDKRRDYAFRALDTLVSKGIFEIRDKLIFKK